MENCRECLKLCIGIVAHCVLCFRNIWDGSILVERVFKSGNREVVAVSAGGC